MATEITVRGSFEHFCAAERATVRADVGFEGPSIQPVFDRTVRALETVRSSVAELHDPEHGPVTWWSAQQIRTWAQRPWNSQGKQLPLVHHARVGLQVKFRDFAALSRWLGRHVETTEGFTLAAVDWALTAVRREELQRDARTRAVRDARTRAQQYADALDLGAVRPVAIADTGMLARAGDTAAPVAFARGAAAGGATSEPALVPEDIGISAEVEARFVAGDR